MNIAVVHLCRKANGADPLRRFLKAYADTQPDEKHTLVIAFKGFSSEEDVFHLFGAEYLEEAGVDDVLTTLVPDEGYDVATYRRASKMLVNDYICFLNSWSRPLHKKWLGMLLDGIKDPRVGVVGCTGSYEGIPDNSFPNPHIRTNAFCIRRELFLEISPEDPSREASLNFEAGDSSMTKQLLARDLDCVVASTKGCWELEREPFSNTFRWGDQRDLLIADNRTDAFQDASPKDRAYLQKLAWGRNE